jgi:hypothetical protein
LLTLEDAHRFRKSRDVGCYLGLQPGRRNSGQSEPQMHISKEGDPYLRTLLVQGAHHILGPFGAESRSAPLGIKAGRTWREEREETSHYCRGAKVSRPAASEELWVVFRVGKNNSARPLAVGRRMDQDASPDTGPGCQFVVFSFASSRSILVLPEHCCL